MPRDHDFIQMIWDKVHELEALLTANLPLPRDVAAPGIAKAKAIIQEIQAHGIMVKWRVEIPASSPAKISVVVSLLAPKADLSPEDQKIYDKWFAKVNNLPPPI